MPSNDARRWQTGPHVRQSIAYVREIFHYLHKVDIHMYRMSSDFAPYLTHPDMPQFHGQLEEARDELAELGALARTYDIRLSLHPSQYILLNAQDEEVARKSILGSERAGQNIRLYGLRAGRRGRNACRRRLR